MIFYFDGSRSSHPERGFGDLRNFRGTNVVNNGTREFIV